MKSPSWTKIKDYIYKKYGQESGKMIVHAGIITWATSSLAQIAAVAFNDKIPSEQKKFLVPQEIADGIVNIATFYLVTNSLKNIAGKLVSTGKWSTHAIRKFVEKNPKLKIKMGSLETNLSKTFKENKEFHDSYDTFKGGMEMMASTIGSVASCNLVTPLIRNSWGAKQQKISIAKDNQRNHLDKTKLASPTQITPKPSMKI